MKRVILAALLFLPLVSALGQSADSQEKIRIMTLGVFHFNYPNLDAHQIASGNEIDVLDSRHQSEIEHLVASLKKFGPTRIAVEIQPKYQARYDSLYDSYLDGKLALGRNEVFQIGFRLGKLLGIKRLSCVDEQGRFYRYLDTLFADSARGARFEYYYYHNPDSLIKKEYVEFYGAMDTFPKSVGIIRTLERINKPRFIMHLLGAYFTGDFKYEEKSGDFTGVDFETCRWYDRNLRIFRNIQRITEDPRDRILVIIGDGHLGLLNYFFRCSPEYELVSPLEYLR